MVAVPRLFETLRARILKTIEKDGGLPAYLLARAVGIEARRAGRDRADHRRADGQAARLSRCARRSRPNLAKSDQGDGLGRAPLNPEVGTFAGPG
jgi:long-chain acyl-CoA synthetase